jgi:small basic protein (TIGR04137 family)
MSLDPTLKHGGGLSKNRSVMTRAERISMMMEEGEFDPEESAPLGLPKLQPNPDVTTNALSRLDPAELTEKLKDVEGTPDE